MLCEGLKVSGVEMPLKVKPVPLTLNAEIVTLTPPVFVIVSDNAELLPTVTVPKLRLVGFAVSVPGVTPAPDNGIDNVAFEAFEVTISVPVAFPVA